MKKNLLLLSVIIGITGLFVLSGCDLDDNDQDDAIELLAEEKPFNEIKLVGEVAFDYAEVSSLSWYNDDFIIMPQYPELFSEVDGMGNLYKLTREELTSYINGDVTFLEPQAITLKNMPKEIEGYEGYEAIDFKDDQVYLLIEAETDALEGYLIRGTINEAVTEIVLEPETMRRMDTPVSVENAAFESILLTDDGIMCIYEANGKNLNPNPTARVFDYDLQPKGYMSFPSIEYRITDATRLNRDNTFYVINFFFPGDSESYNPAIDWLALDYGLPGKHYDRETVERLVKMRYNGNEIEIVEDTPPVYVELMDDESRNLEGIVTFDKNTLIIIADEYPGTLLGFVKVD